MFTSLIHFIETRLPFYQERWKEHFQEIENATPTDLPQLILNALLYYKLTDCHVDPAHLLACGAVQNEASHTLLLYHCSDLQTLKTQTLSSFFAHLSVLDAYQQMSGSLPLNVILLLDGMGAATDTTLQRLLQKTPYSNQRIDYCLLIDNKKLVGVPTSPRPALALGYKGLLRVELTVEHPLPRLESAFGGIVPDASWQLLWALNHLKDEREEILIAGFYDTIEPVEDTVVETFYSLPTHAQVLIPGYPSAKLLLGLQGFQAYYVHLLTPSCTITALSADHTKDDKGCIASRARAQLDFYLVPGQEPDDIFHKLQQHLTTAQSQHVNTRLLYRSLPAYTITTHPFVQQVARSTTRACEREPVLLPLIAYTLPLQALQHEEQLPVVILSTATEASIVEDLDQQWLKSVRQLALLLQELA